MRYSRQFNQSQNGSSGQPDEPASVDVTSISTVTEVEPTAIESLDFSSDWLEVRTRAKFAVNFVVTLQIYVAANNFVSLCTVSVYLLVSLIILS